LKKKNLPLIFLLNLISLLILFSGCDRDNIIEQEKLVLIYSDLLIASDTSAVNENNLDSLRTSVFNRYSVTEEEYENTLEYYNEELERWDEFFDKVNAHIENLKQKSD
jgi:hypothetical protein